MKKDVSKLSVIIALYISYTKESEANNSSMFFRKKLLSLLMPYKDMKAITFSPVGDTDFLHIVTGVLQGDT